jgi:hypothetical protein
MENQPAGMSTSFGSADVSSLTGDAMCEPLIWLMSLAQTSWLYFLLVYKQEEMRLRRLAKAMDIRKTGKKSTGYLPLKCRTISAMSFS